MGSSGSKKKRPSGTSGFFPDVDDAPGAGESRHVVFRGPQSIEDIRPRLMRRVVIVSADPESQRECWRLQGALQKFFEIYRVDFDVIAVTESKGLGAHALYSKDYDGNSVTPGLLIMMCPEDKVVSAKYGKCLRSIDADYKATWKNNAARIVFGFTTKESYQVSSTPAIAGILGIGEEDILSGGNISTLNTQTLARRQPELVEQIKKTFDIGGIPVMSAIRMPDPGRGQGCGSRFGCG